LEGVARFPHKPGLSKERLQLDHSNNCRPGRIALARGEGALGLKTQLSDCTIRSTSTVELPFSTDGFPQQHPSAVSLALENRNG